MNRIIFGPSGLGSVSDAISNLEEYSRLGLRACEIAFVRQVYIKKDEAIEIGRVAKNLGIFLSIHAPYYVNLNSTEKEKIEASKARILKCCEIGHYLGVRRVVFHCGFYSGMKSEDAREIIKLQIVEMMAEVKKKGWNVELCPEVMGKINVFGSLDEISWLVKETGCGFCIDFAHVLARYGRNEFDEINNAFPSRNWHCHFSGIEYGDKGEKNHKLTGIEEWKNLLGFLKGIDKEMVIINESPNPISDSVNGLEIWNRLN
jgi:deoxyribonuclease IV